LKTQGVIGQKLPFQSGFHSSFFADYIKPLHDALDAGTPPNPPARCVWSATSVAPFPADPTAIMELAVRHLVEPVRFRELIEAMHARGVRVFLQLGTGRLVSFVEDTLRGRPYLALDTNVPGRSGLAQLRRVLCALFVEGADGLDFERVGTAPRAASLLELGVPLVPKLSPLGTDRRPPAPARVPTHPLAEAFSASLDALDTAQRDVFARLAELEQQRAPRPSGAHAPRAWSVTRRLSVAEQPELLDHAFYHQRAGWPVVADTFPLMPLTGSIELAMEVASAPFPERIVAAVEDIRAYRWLDVTQPVELEIRCHYDGQTRVKVRLGDYAEAVIVLAEEYGSPPPADARPHERERDTITPAQLYADRWMFHGPAYRGVVGLGPLGDDGLRARLRAGGACGSLLDAAGQVFGFWGQQAVEFDRIVLPIGAERIEFYGPKPVAGEEFDCTVRITELKQRSLVGTVEITQSGKVWAKLIGWEDRRFECDPRLWTIMTQTPRAFLSDALPGTELCWFHDPYRSAPTRDQLSRRYLSECERTEYAAQTPRRQRLWLTGRIAGKDALRRLTQARDGIGRFPAEYVLTGDADATVSVRSDLGRELRVAIAHHDHTAVALATAGARPFIALVPVHPANDANAAPAADSFSASELALVAHEPEPIGHARLRVARDVAAKLPTHAERASTVVRDRNHDRLLVGSAWITTLHRDDMLIGWTQIEGEPK
jgi:malonyl CoA-acyl carrier protein transacylase